MAGAAGVYGSVVAVRLRWLAGLLLALIVLAGCAPRFDPGPLFPERAGDYVRVDGPNADRSGRLFGGAYRAPDGGSVTLLARHVGVDAVAQAVLTLPEGAENQGYDPSMGARKGLTFAYNGEQHAAWANGDWVFVLSAPDVDQRAAFLAGYGF